MSKRLISWGLILFLLTANLPTAEAISIQGVELMGFNKTIAEEEVYTFRITVDDQVASTIQRTSIIIWFNSQVIVRLTYANENLFLDEGQQYCTLQGYSSDINDRILNINFNIIFHDLPSTNVMKVTVQAQDGDGGYSDWKHVNFPIENLIEVEEPMPLTTMVLTAMMLIVPTIIIGVMLQRMGKKQRRISGMPQTY